MSKLIVLIGAGFSASVGMPLGKDIQARFDRDQRNKLLILSSSEWFWTDGKDEVFIHNGSISSENIYYSYILNEVIINYKYQKKGFVDYEDFFEFILESLKDDTWLTNIYSSAKQELFKDKPEWNNPKVIEFHPYLNDFPFSTKLISLLNHLIADLLSIKISDEQLILSYKAFVNYIMSFKEVSIFTLNHDLILERTFEMFGVKFTRGFSDNNSEVFFENKSLPSFNNDFQNCTIKICKLHGSLDYFRYTKNDGTYNYFTTRGYRAKHWAQTRNLETNEVITEFNTDIVPKFITGKNKPMIIKNDFMYTKLFEHFESEIASTENLLVSGYSFGDEHINHELMKRNDINIINQNPFNKYPFGGIIKEINTFEEL